MQYTVYLSVQDDLKADLVRAAFPDLAYRQSKMAARVTPDRRWTNFEGILDGSSLGTLLIVTRRLGASFGTLTLGPA